MSDEGDDLYGAALDDACKALSMMTCPHLRGTGICESGCHTEPACETCAPSGEWVGQLHEAAETLLRLSGGKG